VSSSPLGEIGSLYKSEPASLVEKEVQNQEYNYMVMLGKAGI
jgi:hypothetical protein